LTRVERDPLGDASCVTHVEAPAADLSDGQRDIALEKAADEIWRAAQAWVSVQGMRVALQILGHQAAKSLEDGTPGDPLTTVPRVAFPFSVTPPEGVRETFEGGEEADIPGVIGSQQRHADTSLRVAHTTTDRVQERLLQMNRDLLEHVREQDHARLEHYKLIEDLADRKQSRDAAAAESRFNLAVKEQVAEVVFSQVLPLVSLAFKAKLGVLPAKIPDGTEADPVQFVEGLKLQPKQLAQFVGSLDEKQREHLSPIVYGLQAKMTKEQQAELRDELQRESDRIAREKKLASEAVKVREKDKASS
jgi:hypothetical protein